MKHFSSMSVAAILLVGALAAAGSVSLIRPTAHPHQDEGMNFWEGAARGLVRVTMVDLPGDRLEAAVHGIPGSTPLAADLVQRDECRTGRAGGACAAPARNAHVAARLQWVAVPGGLPILSSPTCPRSTCANAWLTKG